MTQGPVGHKGPVGCYGPPVCNGIEDCHAPKGSEPCYLKTGNTMAPQERADKIQVPFTTNDLGQQVLDPHALSEEIAAALREYGDVRAAEEREACASLADTFECDGRPLDLVDLAADIANAIRARGNLSPDQGKAVKAGAQPR